jgi:hypothetical protein
MRMTRAITALASRPPGRTACARAARLGAEGLLAARRRFAGEVIAPQMAAFYRRVRASAEARG